MVERPQKTGLDKALEFLSIATGNAATVIEQRQEDLNAYDSEIKRQNAVLNMADVNIAQSKISGILNQQFVDDPKKFKYMSRDEWDDHVNGVMVSQIDVQNITDPMSSINLVDKTLDISDKGWVAVQKIQSDFATKDAIQELGYIMNSAFKPEQMPDVEERQRKDYDEPYIDYSDADSVMDALDSLYVKGRQKGVDFSKVNPVLISFVKENAGTLGADNGLVREIMSKKLGTVADRTAIQKGIDTYNDVKFNNNFDKMLQDIFLGRPVIFEGTKLSLVDQEFALDWSIKNTSTPAKRDAMIKQIGNKIVELGNPDYENGPLYRAFKKNNGHAIYDLTSKFATAQKNKRKNAEEEERIANLNLIAQEIYKNPVSTPYLGDFTRLVAADKRDVLSIIQNLLIEDGSSETTDAIERSLGMLLPGTSDALRPLDSATRDYLFSTTKYANANEEDIDKFTEAMGQLQRLENSGVNWWKDFDSDQRSVAESMLRVLKYNPRFVKDNGVSELIKIGFKGAELERQGMLPYGLSPSDIKNFEVDIMGVKRAEEYEAYSNADYVKGAYFTEYTVARASGLNHKASVTEAQSQMEDRIVRYDYEKLHEAFALFGIPVSLLNKDTEIYSALVLPKFLTGIIDSGDDGVMNEYSARMKQLLDRQPFIQEQMGENIDKGNVIFVNNPTNHNQYIVSYRDENGDEIYSSAHDWQTLELKPNESISQWSPNR